MTPTDGVLLYAQAESEFDLRYEVHGHRVRVVSVDLKQDYAVIGQKLLAICQEREIGTAMAAD